MRGAVDAPAHPGRSRRPWRRGRPWPSATTRGPRRLSHPFRLRVRKFGPFRATRRGELLPDPRRLARRRLLGGRRAGPRGTWPRRGGARLPAPLSGGGLRGARPSRAAGARRRGRSPGRRRALGGVRLRRAGRGGAPGRAARAPVPAAGRAHPAARRAAHVPGGFPVSGRPPGRDQRLGRRRGRRHAVPPPSAGDRPRARTAAAPAGAAARRLPARRPSGHPVGAGVRGRRRVLRAGLEALHGARGARRRADRDSRRPLPDGRRPGALADLLDRLARESYA